MDGQKENLNWERLLITLGIVVVTAGVIGGMTWYFMDKQAKHEKTANDKQILSLQKQIDELTKIQEKTDNKTMPSVQTKEEAILQAQEYQPEGICTAVMTPSIHKATGATYTFSSGCLPPGWSVLPRK